MAASGHDPDVSPVRRTTEPGGETGEDDLARRVAAAQQWLVDELRDECSDIGVGAHGFDLDAFSEGVAVFAREARRLGAPPERMLVLLKQCLANEAIPRAGREHYQLYMDVAVSAAVRAYFAPAAGRDEARETRRAGGPERPQA